MVRGTFSPARAWRPAVGARLARTLGLTNTPHGHTERSVLSKALHCRLRRLLCPCAVASASLAAGNDFRRFRLALKTRGEGNSDFRQGNAALRDIQDGSTDSRPRRTGRDLSTCPTRTSKGLCLVQGDLLSGTLRVVSTGSRGQTEPHRYESVRNPVITPSPRTRVRPNPSLKLTR